MSCNYSGDQHWVACERRRISAEYVRVRGLTLINTILPPPPQKKNCLERNIIPCTFNMIICTGCIKIKGKKNKKNHESSFRQWNHQIVILSHKSYAISFQRKRKIKVTKYDLTRTRIWNLLLRSQTAYPLGHEAEIGRIERPVSVNPGFRFFSIFLYLHSYALYNSPLAPR